MLAARAVLRLEERGGVSGADATTGSGALRGAADAGGSVDATGRSSLCVIINTRLATKHKPASVAMTIRTFPNTVIMPSRNGTRHKAYHHCPSMGGMSHWNPDGRLRVRVAFWPVVKC
jgi:hypothetical protein